MVQMIKDRWLFENWPEYKKDERTIANCKIHRKFRQAIDSNMG